MTSMSRTLDNKKPTKPISFSQFSETTRPYVENLATFFTETQEEQENRNEYLKTLEVHWRLAAVLVLLFEERGELRGLLTTRGKNLKVHGGQTSLPGGKMDDQDKDIIFTAFREANEEVNLLFPQIIDSSIRLLGTLDLHLFHKLIVTPVVALLLDNSLLKQLQAKEGEVDHIFSHPLEAFLHPDYASTMKDLTPHGGNDWPYEPEYHYFKDYFDIEPLGGCSYRYHHFRSSASPITGLTADIMISVAQIAFKRETVYGRYEPKQLRTFSDTLQAFELQQKRKEREEDTAR